jgi:hypothetical protein
MATLNHDGLNAEGPQQSDLLIGGRKIKANVARDRSFYEGAKGRQLKREKREKEGGGSEIGRVGRRRRMMTLSKKKLS